ncbi:MAG: DUF559 domain-containing protein [Geodermatophilaceae bacterium]|nr:DUF559 domain-containing protein [Geodermatophilaceae bacterium]
MPNGVRDIAELRAWSLLVPPGAAFTHLTAAALRGWWLPPLPRDLPVFLAVPDAGWRPRRSGLHVTRHTSDIPYGWIDGLPISEPAEILLATARHLGLLDLVILCDSALHVGDVTLDELARAAAKRRRGAPVLRRALSMLDGRSESPWETLLRLLHTTCEVPVDVQAPILDEHGQLGARADLRIVGTRRLVEYDGAHHRDARQYERDRARDRWLQALGWVLYSYSATTVRRQPQLILRDADQALGRPDDPGRLDTWYSLMQDSAFTAAGMGRFRARLGLSANLAG